MLKEYPEIHLNTEVKSVAFAAPIFAKRAIIRSFFRLHHRISIKILKVSCQILDGKRGLHYCLVEQKYIVEKKLERVCQLRRSDAK